MIHEFKEFINRGGVVELAVAFIMGVAFSPIVSALVDRVIMPLVAMLFGEPNFDHVGTFGQVDQETGMPAGSVGAVLTAAVNFLLISFVLFFVVKAYNRFKGQQEEEEEAVAGPSEIDLLTEIRDALTTR